jgi:hypothetical protein
MNECPVVKKYKEKIEKEQHYDFILTTHRSQSNKSLEQCAAILSQTSDELDKKLYYAKIATQVKY